MATRYYLNDTNNETTCDSGWNDPRDLTKTQGTPTTITSVGTQSVPFTQLINWIQDVSGDSPTSGTFDTSLDVQTSDAASEWEYRIAVAFINGSCSRGATEGTDIDTGPTLTGTGIKTDTTASLTWGSYVQLHVQFQGRKIGSHGNKSSTINVNDADCYVDAPWNLPPTLDQISVQLFNDDASTATADDHTAIAAQDVAVGVEGTQKFWVRFLVDCTAGSGTLGATMQFRVNGGSWTSITTSTSVRIVSSGTTTDGTATTSRMTGGTGTFTAGSMETSSGNATDVTINSTQKTEVMYCCQWNGATQEDLYEFRLIGVNDETTALTTYTSIGEVYADCLAMAFQDGVSPTTSYTGCQDTYIKNESGQEGTNYDSQTTVLFDGEHPASSGAVAWGLLKWDISSISGSYNVLAVEVDWTINAAGGGAAGNPYESCEVTASWSESTVTWTSLASNWNTTSLGTCNTPDSAGTRATSTLNATGIALVQDWIDGVTTNNGFILIDTAGTPSTDGATIDSTASATAANYPRLLILYETASAGAVYQPPVRAFIHNLVR